VIVVPNTQSTNLQFFNHGSLIMLVLYKLLKNVSVTVGIQQEWYVDCVQLNLKLVPQQNL